MDKCWFVLRQTSFWPPPRITHDRSGQTVQQGVLCLGDLVTDLGSLSRIDESGRTPLHADVPVFQARSGPIDWTANNSKSRSLSAALGLPIAALLGATVGAELGPEVEKSLARHADAEAMEAAIIRPTRSYIESVLSTPDVQEWIANKTFGRWALYMVTGMMILKGKKSLSAKAHSHKTIKGGPDITLDGIATAKLQGGLHSGKDSSLETDDLSDCIWAVTVTKISKGFLDSTWNAEPFSKAATFSNAEAPANVDDLLATEYLGDSGIVPLNDGGTLVFLEENNEKP